MTLLYTSVFKSIKREIFKGGLPASNETMYIKILYKLQNAFQKPVDIF
jgi:hypothetical protein